MRHGLGAISVSILLAHSLALAGCRSTANDKPSTATSPAPVKSESWIDEYDQLVKEIVEYNGPSPVQIGAWTMNTEHLFPGDLTDPNILRNRVIRFLRKPGVLNGLFEKLAAPQISAESTLIIAEMLVFFGQYHVAGDEGIKAPAAADVDRLLKRGAFADLDTMFDSPVQRVLSYSVDKAIGRRGPYLPTEDSWIRSVNNTNADVSKNA